MEIQSIKNLSELKKFILIEDEINKICITNNIIISDDQSFYFSTGYLDDANLIRSDNIKLNINLGLYLNEMDGAKEMIDQVFYSLTGKKNCVFEDVFNAYTKYKKRFQHYKYTSDCELLRTIKRGDNFLVKFLLQKLDNF